MAQSRRVAEPHPPAHERPRHRKGGAFVAVLSALGRCLPGEQFKTAVYLNCIIAPRKTLRQAVIGHRYKGLPLVQILV